MADLILWNSIARRRRSPADDFPDNGLAILKAYVENHGYQVEVIDWARGSQWEKMTPRLLARLNRLMAVAILGSRSFSPGLNKAISRLISPLFIMTQESMSAIQGHFEAKLIRSLAKYVSDSGCRVAGIKAWYGEAYKSARFFARCLRELDPEVLIVVGGPHPTTYRQAVLEDEIFDIAVAGEGERVLVGILELAQQAKTRKELLDEITREASQGNLKNVIYRCDGKVEISPPGETDANDKVIPVYDNFESKTRIHVVVESLGCPWGKCNFCTHSCTYKKYSIRQPEAVVEEIEGMLAKGIGIFRFSGSSTSLSHARRIAEVLEERGLRISYSMFGRAESRAAEKEVYDKVVDSYRQLLRSGFRSIFLGAESAMDIINDRVMNKGITRSDIVATSKAMREASRIEGLPMDIGISLIYPAPTLGLVSLERLKTENIRLVEEIEPDSVLVSPPAPFPGSAWFREKDRFGFELGDSFVRDMLEYDYILYKPLFLWPEIGIRLEGMSQRQIFEECESLRRALDQRGIATEVTDVQFLMLRAAGYEGKEGVLRFKKQTQLDLLSCDYRWINALQLKVNQASLALASANKDKIWSPISGNTKI